MTTSEIITIMLGVLGMMGAIIASAVIVGNRVCRMQEQLAQIVKHLDQGEKRMDNFDDRIGQHDARLSCLESKP